jgi:hypothetical protein
MGSGFLERKRFSNTYPVPMFKSISPKPRKSAFQEKASNNKDANAALSNYTNTQ